MKRIKQNNAMAIKLGIKGLKSSLDAMKLIAMKLIRSPPVDSCSEYYPNDYSNLEESKADGLSCSPNKVSVLILQGFIGCTYLATDALHCFYFVELPLA